LKTARHDGQQFTVCDREEAGFMAFVFDDVEVGRFLEALVVEEVAFRRGVDAGTGVVGVGEGVGEEEYCKEI
jgi:hypothetical protein